MYIYVYIYIYNYIYTHTYTYTYIHASMHACMHTYIYIYIYTRTTRALRARLGSSKLQPVTNSQLHAGARRTNGFNLI